jgi:RNA polymerase sigma factor FliA
MVATSSLDQARAPGGRRSTPAEALALWRRYRQTNDPKLRDRLVMTYAPMVKYIVFRKLAQMPAHQEADDYISRGLIAMIAALDRFDPDRGASLEQFLWTRIHGAVIDEMRAQDWAPRSVRRFERQVLEAAHNFRALHGRTATTEELADALAVPVERLRAHRDDLARGEISSLNRIAGDEEEGTEHVEQSASSDLRSQPERAALLSDAKLRLREAFAQLAPREQEVLVLLYVKNLNLQETGHVLGVSESRISQIHSAVRKKLRGLLGDHHDALELLEA